MEKNNINQENSENDKSKDNKEKKEEKTLTPEEKITELENKLTRTFAEMENQRRRYEKEKDDAFEYGGFAFAREALNLLDNLERSKISLENDDTLKNTDTLKKVIEHLIGSYGWFILFAFLAKPLVNLMDTEKGQGFIIR